MFSLRSIFFRPKKSDYPLARFFYADLELKRITNDLDSFDGNKEPQRCQKLIDRLRKTQQRVMEVVWTIVRTCVLEETRASRQYRDKFPEELRGDHMSGPLWFGAECLAAGSSVLNHESESDELRPLARHITTVMEAVRTKLREQCLRDVSCYPEELVDTLRWFDYNWAEFEFSYVSRMCPVKTTEELYQQHITTILFSETTAQALKDKFITEDQMSSYDPVLMLAIPRLSILGGLEQEGGLLDLNKDTSMLPVYFRPHVSNLIDIKQSLSNLTPEEVTVLKQCLASSVDPLQAGTNMQSEPDTMQTDTDLEPESDMQTDTDVEPETDNMKTEEETPTETDPLLEVDSQTNTDTQGSSQRRDALQCLYLAVSSIADQMITNHAKDLRQMLHHTFKMNQPFEPSKDVIMVAKTDEIRQITSTCVEPSTSEEISAGESRHHVLGQYSDCGEVTNIPQIRQEPPTWVPDCQVTRCSSCDDMFTLLKRKHHCRYCGQDLTLRSGGEYCYLKDE
ncbi:hypothetical protein ACHWQZ_G018432 [Mnemiopsis leidyi]